MAALQLRTKHRKLYNPSLIHLFSTSPPPPDPITTDQSSSSTSPHPSQSQSKISSYFSDVKASLQQQQQQHQQQRATSPFSPRNPANASNPSNPVNPSFSKPSSAASIEEIRKNLSEFRLRASVPPPTVPNSAPSTSPSSPSSLQHISFQELYKRNVPGKVDEKGTNTEWGPGKKLSFDTIRESLRHLRPSSGALQNERSGDSLSLSKYNSSLKLKPSMDSGPVIGGTDPLPVSVFGKEMERKKTEGETMAMKTEFVKNYSVEELGHKLRKLRPEGKKSGEGWFSLGELSERLMKLREMDEKETESNVAGLTYRDLRESLYKLKMSDDEKAKKSSIQRLNVLGQLGRTSIFMLQPPKEHLVEKYLHPDNMSSEEKLKIELAKVRDEFKMSESDCGSARVQVAQLTTKIKHLSSVLHKKDKHSLKGLQGMVQRRKRLLKYLRRTDWDSYCLVLSRLGLRDNPNYKS